MAGWLDTRTVRCRFALWLFVLSGCYSPTARPGSPCDDDRGCPTPLVCSAGTCEPPGQVDGAPIPDAVGNALDGPTVIPMPDAEADAAVDPICGSVARPCEPNDRAAGAIDVTAGGTFSADLLRAHDDLANNGCNLDGGAEVFYQVNLAVPEVYYFDTFGSTFDTSVRVFPGTACTAVTAAMTPVCDDDECDSGQSQLAVALPMGLSCVAVDKNSDAGHEADQGAMQLVVVRGTRTGLPLPRGVATLTGNTCDATEVSDPPRMICQFGNAAPDLAYFFTACPNKAATVDASTCADATKTHFDTMLYIQSVAGDPLACNDDDASCPARQERPDSPDGSRLVGITTRVAGLHWLVIDGFDAACGRYQLVTNYR